MTLDELRGEAQRFTEEVARESYLAYSGHKAEAELQAIYERYAHLTSSATLARCRALFRAAPAGSEEQRAARMLLDWQVDAQTGRALAALDEREIEAENHAIATLPDGEAIPYQRIAIDIMNEPDHARRVALDSARAEVVRDVIGPIRLERLQRERETVESLGIADGYNATFETVSGISLGALAGQCERFLADTADMWRDLLAEVLRTMRLAPGEATRADALAFFRLREFDDAFGQEEMVPAIRRHCSEMGVDATAEGRVTLDLEDRPGKRPRAFCSPVRIPQEVYLVLRPRGGQADWGTLLHELGHALHFGYARADYPFEYRWLGDNSVTEGYAMLFDHRMASLGWLLRYSGLTRARARDFVRIGAVEELHFVRRYCAKLLYELQVYGGGIAWRALPEHYAELLTGATGLRHRTEDAFTDLDPRFYSSRYLRAWQLQALLDEALTERFDEDWWRNPSAGPWIVGELFGEGQRETADELAARVSGRSLGFEPVIASARRALDT